MYCRMAVCAMAPKQCQVGVARRTYTFGMMLFRDQDKCSLQRAYARSPSCGARRSQLRGRSATQRSTRMESSSNSRIRTPARGEDRRSWRSAFCASGIRRSRTVTWPLTGAVFRRLVFRCGRCPWPAVDDREELLGLRSRRDQIGRRVGGTIRTASSAASPRALPFGVRWQRDRHARPRARRLAERRRDGRQARSSEANGNRRGHFKLLRRPASYGLPVLTPTAEPHRHGDGHAIAAGPCPALAITQSTPATTPDTAAITNNRRAARAK